MGPESRAVEGSGDHARRLCTTNRGQAMWRAGDQIWLNPGSVGLPAVGPGTAELPRNRDVSWAEFALVEINRYETSVDLRRLELDIGAVRAAAQATDMPHQDWWLNLWRL